MNEKFDKYIFNCSEWEYSSYDKKDGNWCETGNRDTKRLDIILSYLETDISDAEKIELVKDVFVSAESYFYLPSSCTGGGQLPAHINIFKIDLKYYDNHDVKNIIAAWPQQYEFIPKEFSDDKEIALKCIEAGSPKLLNSKFGSSISFSDKLLDDVDIVSNLILKGYNKLKDNKVLNKLKIDIDFIKKVIEITPPRLDYSLRGTWQFQLSFISERLFNNKEFAKFLIKHFNYNENFQHSRLESQGTSGIVLLENISDTLKKDEDFISKTISLNVFFLKLCDTKITDSKSIIEKAIKVSPIALKFASKRLKDNYEVVSLALDINNNFVRSVEYSGNLEELKGTYYNDRRCVKGLLSFASSRLRNYDSIVELAIKKDIRDIQYASERLQQKYSFEYDIVMEHEMIEETNRNNAEIDAEIKYNKSFERPYNDDLDMDQQSWLGDI